MLDVDLEGFPKELIWYVGEETEAFLDAISRMPLGEKDCCLCFPNYTHREVQGPKKGKAPGKNEWWGWDGGVIYVLKQPFLLDIEDNTAFKGGEPIRRWVEPYLALSSSTGGGNTEIGTEHLALLLRYFGPDMVIEWAEYV